MRLKNKDIFVTFFFQVYFSNLQLKKKLASKQKNMKLVKTSSQKKNLCIRKHPGQLCYCLWPLSRVRGKKGNKKHENGSQEENKNVHAKTGRKKEKKQKQTNIQSLTLTQGSNRMKQ